MGPPYPAATDRKSNFTIRWISEINGQRPTETLSSSIFCWPLFRSWAEISASRSPNKSQCSSRKRILFLRLSLVVDLLVGCSALPCWVCEVEWITKTRQCEMWYGLCEDPTPTSTMRKSRTRIPYPKRRYRKIRGQFAGDIVDCVNSGFRFFRFWNHISL